MMFDFRDIMSATKDEQVRAWSIEQAIDSFNIEEVTDEELIRRASKIEEFVKNKEA